MADYTLVPVDYQPDFGNASLVPVDYNPFPEDAPQPAQNEQAQSQSAQPQQPATGVERLYVSPLRENTRASVPNPSIAPTSQPPAPTQVGYTEIPQATPSSEPTSNVVTPRQILHEAVNQFYPGAQYSALAQQAYKNGQYGNAIGYGVGAVADSLLALSGGKLLGAGIAAGVDALRGIRGSSRALGRALEAAGHTRQAGHDAHHIVAKNARPADPAYLKLQELGIGINDAANGVFLERAKHQHLHDKQYYEAVNRALAGAKSKAEAEQILRSIAQRLQSGTFP